MFRGHSATSFAITQLFICFLDTGNLATQLIVDWMFRVAEIENDAGMWLCSSTLWVQSVEVDGAVEVKRAVDVNVDVQRLVISRGVNKADRTGLHEVICDHNVSLVGSDLNVVGTNGGLDLIRIIETLDIGQIGDIERGDVVGGRESQVDELAILGEIGVNGSGVASLGAEVVEKLGNALVSILVEFEGVNDPDLAKVDCSGKSCSIWVSRNKLDILDTATLWNGDGADDSSLFQIPESQSVRSNDLEAGFQD